MPNKNKSYRHKYIRALKVIEYHLNSIDNIAKCITQSPHNVAAINGHIKKACEVKDIFEDWITKDRRMGDKRKK